LAGGIGGGTIFRLKPGERGWTLDTLYEFGNYSGDGFFPVSMRFAPEGGLYGTTEDGGNVASCGNNGCGTVFVFEPSGLGSIN
jgi:hypothetical protein